LGASQGNQLTSLQVTLLPSHLQVTYIGKLDSLLAELPPTQFSDHYLIVILSFTTSTFSHLRISIIGLDSVFARADLAAEITDTLIGTRGVHYYQYQVLPDPEDLITPTVHFIHQADLYYRIPKAFDLITYHFQNYKPNFLQTSVARILSTLPKFSKAIKDLQNSQDGTEEGIFYYAYQDRDSSIPFDNRP